MREMKDSGVEWIGEVPRVWRVERFKGLVTNVTEPIPQGPSLSVPLENVEPWTGRLINTATSEDSEGCAKGFCSGDVLFSKLRPYLAKVFYAPCAGACSGEMLVLRPKGIDSRFLSYYLISPSTIDEINGLNFGTKMPRADWNIVCNLRVPLPPIKEQRCIVSYLDKRCAAIDEDVAKRREVIAKLKEYKKTLIAHAVTKGIDPNVEMKDSGVEWIGAVPRSWRLTKIGQVYDLRNTKVSDFDFEPLSVTMKGIVPQLDNAAKTNAHDDRKLVMAGDFVINSRSDRRGSCGIARQSGSVSLINTVLIPRDSMEPRFYDWLFHTSLFADEFYKNGHGIVDDLWTTKWTEMKGITIVEPSLKEQEEIADYLDERCADIDEAISRQEQLIEKLGEYRRSIIHHAVIGKIDCTEAAK